MARRHDLADDGVKVISNLTECQSRQVLGLFDTGRNAQHDGKLTMQTLLVTLLAVFLTVYFGAKRKYVLSALSLAAMFALFRPEMWQ